MRFHCCILGRQFREGLTSVLCREESEHETLKRPELTHGLCVPLTARIDAPLLWLPYASFLFKHGELSGCLMYLSSYGDSQKQPTSWIYPSCCT